MKRAIFEVVWIFPIQSPATIICSKGRFHRRHVKGVPFDDRHPESAVDPIPAKPDDFVQYVRFLST
jgi:hypothetical protein